MKASLSAFLCRRGCSTVISNDGPLIRRDDRDADVCPLSDMLYPPAFEILANPPTEPSTLPLVRHMVRHGVSAIGDTSPVNAREMREQCGRLDNFGVCKHSGAKAVSSTHAASPSLSDSQPKHVTGGAESRTCCLPRYAALRCAASSSCKALYCTASAPSLVEASQPSGCEVWQQPSAFPQP